MGSLAKKVFFLAVIALLAMGVALILAHRSHAASAASRGPACAGHRVKSTFVIVCGGVWNNPYALRIKSRLGWSRLTWSFGCSPYVLSDGLDYSGKALRDHSGSGKSFGQVFSAEGRDPIAEAQGLQAPPPTCTLFVSLQMKRGPKPTWSLNRS